jgi:hypothetical protein
MLRILRAAPFACNRVLQSASAMLPSFPLPAATHAARRWFSSEKGNARSVGAVALNTLSPAPGSRRVAKRLGRGVGSGTRSLPAAPHAAATVRTPVLTPLRQGEDRWQRPQRSDGAPWFSSTGFRGWADAAVPPRAQARLHQPGRHFPHAAQPREAVRIHRQRSHLDRRRHHHENAVRLPHLRAQDQRSGHQAAGHRGQEL